jgi:hypothetical protein
MPQSTLGQTPEYAWLMELMQRGFPETGHRINADVQVIMSMCKAEPKSAQFAIQHLAQDVREARRQPKDPDAAERLPIAEFMLGALFLGYCALAMAEGRVPENRYPPELAFSMQLYPEIQQCADAIQPPG